MLWKMTVHGCRGEWVYSLPVADVHDVRMTPSMSTYIDVCIGDHPPEPRDVDIMYSGQPFEDGVRFEKSHPTESGDLVYQSGEVQITLPKEMFILYRWCPKNLYIEVNGDPPNWEEMQ